MHSDSSSDSNSNSASKKNNGESVRKGPAEGQGRVVGPGFNRRVYELVRKIPKGSVATYGDIAAALGEARVARHVGWALASLRSEAINEASNAANAKQFNSENVPWHRVVNAKGSISVGGNPLRPPEQSRRLRDEGVEVSRDNKFDLKRYRVKNLDT